MDAPHDATQGQELTGPSIGPAEVTTPTSGAVKDDVFISYSRRDQEACNTVYKWLKRAGFRAWRDKRLEGGDVWLAEILKKLGESQCFVILLSEHSVTSKWVRKEVQDAIRREVNEGLRILVLKLGNVRSNDPVFKHLESYQWVNANGESWEDALPELEKRVREILQPPPPSPPVTPPHEPLPERVKRLWKRTNAGLRLLYFRYRKWAAWVLPFLLIAIFSLGIVAYTQRGEIKKWLGMVPPPIVVDHGPHPPEPPVLAFSTDGVIEIATSGVRGLSARLVHNGERYAISNEEAPSPDAVGSVKGEFSHSLTYTPAERAPGRRVRENKQFDPTSFSEVARDVREMIARMNAVGIKKDNIWIVVSSGVAQIVKSKLPTEEEAEAEGWESPSKVAESCVDDMKRRMSDQVGDVPVEMISPVAEANYLLKEVFRRNKKQTGLVSELSEEGDAVVIDVGSGNVKGAYFNPGLGKYEFEQVNGILRDIPGTKAFERRVLGKNSKPTETVEDPVALSDKFRQEAVEWIAKPLREEYSNISMLGESHRVYVAGGAFWLMCRIMRPDADLDAPYVLLMNRREKEPRRYSDLDEDFKRFRDRLIAEGDDAFEYPPPRISGNVGYEEILKERLRELAGDPQREERYHRELQAVKSKFAQSQRLAAAEILIAIDEALLRVTKREVYFVNDGLFDYLTSYLVEKVNEKETRNRGEHRK